MIHGYTEEETLTAMCIWEYALADQSTMIWLKQDQGASLARANALTLVETVEHFYALAIDDFGYDDSFDWEFVPACIDLMLEKAERPGDTSFFNYEIVRKICYDREVK